MAGGAPSHERDDMMPMGELIEEADVDLGDEGGDDDLEGM